MAITLSTNYKAELAKGENRPNVVIEIALDSGTKKYGYHDGGFNDVEPSLKSVSSLQNKLDPKKGYSTRGTIRVVISGRDNFKSLVQDEYLKNRRVTRKDGFIADGFTYPDYAATFAGKIVDWSRKGDEFTLIVADDLVDAAKKIPIENSTKTQLIDYRNTNPVDVITDILSTRLGIDASLIDTAQFTSERDSWMQAWAFDRVITKPQEANKYLNELQIETNSFIIHDGEKISFKHFAPPVPGESVEEWRDDHHILEGTIACRSGYKDHFYNRIVIYYDYDESGSDKEENFESVHIAADAASQGSSEWDETKTRTIKSKWIRTHTYTQPTNVTGVTLYNVSLANGTGSGALTFNQAANTLTWKAPGGTAGDTITLSKDGKFQLFDADKTKSARVVVETASLPGSNQSDTVTISAIEGADYATYLAEKTLSRYRDPVATIKFSVGLNHVAHNSKFIKPTDLVDLTTDEAFEKGSSGWTKERMMLTSVRPNFSASKVDVEAVQTRLDKLYGWIAPAGYPGYDSASELEKEYAYIKNSSPQYHIW